MKRIGEKSLFISVFRPVRDRPGEGGPFADHANTKAKPTYTPYLWEYCCRGYVHYLAEDMDRDSYGQAIWGHCNGFKKCVLRRINGRPWIFSFNPFIYKWPCPIWTGAHNPNRSLSTNPNVLCTTGLMPIPEKFKIKLFFSICFQQIMAQANDFLLKIQNSMKCQPNYWLQIYF